MSATSSRSRATSTRATSNCACRQTGPPADWRLLRPPPDPSLVWHLLAQNGNKQEFEKAPSCEWPPAPFNRLAGAGDGASSKTRPESGAAAPIAPPADAQRLLVLTTAATATLCLVFCIAAVAFLLRRRSRRRGNTGSRSAAKKKKTATSTEAILTSADQLWTYNSMKGGGTAAAVAAGSYPVITSQGIAVYSGNGAFVATPASLRHAAGCLRHSLSSSCGMRASTLRLVPGSAAAVSPGTLGRHYEEIDGGGAAGAGDVYQTHHGPGTYGPSSIPNRGLPYVVTCSRDGIAYTLGTAPPPRPPNRCVSSDFGAVPTRSSLAAVSSMRRRPPPLCRPPPPPPVASSSSISEDEPALSPTGSSSSSFEHELRAITEKDQRSAQGDNSSGGPMTSSSGLMTSHPYLAAASASSRGRESGYGTAPSRQWRSPPGSNGSDESCPPQQTAPLPYQQPPPLRGNSSMTYV